MLGPQHDHKPLLSTTLYTQPGFFSFYYHPRLTVLVFNGGYI